METRKTKFARYLQTLSTAQSLLSTVLFSYTMKPHVRLEAIDYLGAFDAWTRYMLLYVEISYHNYFTETPL